MHVFFIFVLFHSFYMIQLTVLCAADFVCVSHNSTFEAEVLGGKREEKNSEG